MRTTPQSEGQLVGTSAAQSQGRERSNVTIIDLLVWDAFANSYMLCLAEQVPSCADVSFCSM